MDEAKTVRQEVAQRLADISDDVAARVVSAMVEREAGKRVEQLVKALDELQSAEREGYKLKADIVAYDADGKIASEAYSKERLAERKKNEERVEKLRNGIDKALAGDFSKLNS